jgi:hypothetical protein
MTSPARTRRVATAAAWVAAGALGATAITGLAFASDRSSGPTASPAAVSAAGSTGPAGALGAAGTGRRAGALKNLLHGQFTMTAGDGTKVVDVQRGRLTAASATSLTVVSTDGFSATYAVSSSTTVRKARQTVPVSSLAVGDDVVVRASGGTAVVVRTR